MGLFSSEQPRPDMTQKSSRKVCWEARDKFFACLDKHDIKDAKKNAKEASSKCGNEEQEFEKDCIASWVDYFKEKRVYDIEKEKQLKLLEEQGAIKLETTTSFK